MPIAVPTNTKPLVYALNPLQSEAHALAKEHFNLVTPDHPDADTWRQQADGLLVIGSYVKEDDFEQAAETGKLRYVSKQGTGVDKIDLNAAKKHSIPVMNTPGVNAQAVAELAFGLMVSLARQTGMVDRKIRNGEEVTKKIGWQGQTLFGKTIGVIGGGNIGLAVARMFHRAFDGRVILYDPYLKSLDAWNQVIDPSFITLVSDLDSLLADSDVVTIHVPLTPSTENMISAKQMRAMKPTSILINTSRGGIINEDDLAEALDQGIIFGAGLDAFVNEPPSLSKYPALCASDRVIMSPHIGAACQAVQQATCLAMVQNLVDAFNGKVVNRVA